jgi:hypothetical protein
MVLTIMPGVEFGYARDARMELKQPLNAQTNLNKLTTHARMKFEQANAHARSRKWIRISFLL